MTNEKKISNENLELSKEEFEKLVEKEIELLEQEDKEEDFIDYSDKEYSNIDFEKLDGLSDEEAVEEIDKLVDENDKILERDYLSSLLEQKDRIVYYEVENIYRNEKTKAYKNRLILKKNPPILVIKDDLDNEANFFLTENFTDELIETLQQVKRAYYGFNSPTDLSAPKNFRDKLVYYIKKNPIKIVIPLILLIILIAIFN